MLNLSIVADTLLPTQMFPRLPARATFVADTNFVSGAQKLFLILFRNILCPQQMFPSLRSPRNIMGNNVSATMCPRLPRPLGRIFYHTVDLISRQLQCILLNVDDTNVLPQECELKTFVRADNGIFNFSELSSKAVKCVVHLYSRDMLSLYFARYVYCFVLLPLYLKSFSFLDLR